MVEINRNIDWLEYVNCGQAGVPVICLGQFLIDFHCRLGIQRVE